MPVTTPTTPTTPPDPGALGTRGAQRLATRARLFDAAVAEIARSGLAGTDVAAIAATAGVARGTFYFHFPTKEHVLVELEHAEERKIVATLDTRSGEPADLTSMLTLLVHQVVAAELRLGSVAFRDMLGLHALLCDTADRGRVGRASARRCRHCRYRPSAERRRGG